MSLFSKQNWARFGLLQNITATHPLTTAHKIWSFMRKRPPINGGVLSLVHGMVCCFELLYRMLGPYLPWIVIFVSWKFSYSLISPARHSGRVGFDRLRMNEVKWILEETYCSSYSAKAINARFCFWVDLTHFIPMKRLAVMICSDSTIVPGKCFS